LSGAIQAESVEVINELLNDRCDEDNVNDDVECDEEGERNEENKSDEEDEDEDEEEEEEDDDEEEEEEEEEAEDGSLPLPLSSKVISNSTLVVETELLNGSKKRSARSKKTFKCRHICDADHLFLAMHGPGDFTDLSCNDFKTMELLKKLDKKTKNQKAVKKCQSKKIGQKTAVSKTQGRKKK
jgi:hypothetical protein